MVAETFLVVAPHPLDETLGCGGTMAKYASAGVLISVLIICSGSTTRHRDLKDSARHAMNIFGVTGLTFFDFPENRTDTVPLLNLISAIEEHIKDLRPSKVFAPHPGNLNIDHRTTFEAVATACRPIPSLTVRELVTYEVTSSTNWSPPTDGFAPFVPNMFVDISGALDKKLLALAAYGAEVRMAPHARSLEAVQALAVYRGMGVGLAAAEAFTLVRQIV